MKSIFFCFFSLSLFLLGHLNHLEQFDGRQRLIHFWSVYRWSLGRSSLLANPWLGNATCGCLASGRCPVFTFKMGFVNIRLFRHAINLVRGKYDNQKQIGEVTHFQALTTALSATVGLGNIAGVAIAIGTGGPGATFWMILVGFLGMSSKFTECTLGQKYRKVRKDGRIMGGAMHYLSQGLKDKKLAGLGGFLAGLFCLLCIGGSFGGGNAFQVVQSLDMIKSVVPTLQHQPWIYGILMAVMVGLVIGGIKSIARVASTLFPLCVVSIC